MLPTNAPDNLRLAWLGVAIAFLLPTIATVVYFVFGPRFELATRRVTYVAMKILEFGFPVVWLCAVLGEPIHWWRPSWAGIGLGAAFGLAVGAAGWLLYAGFLRGTPMFSASVDIVQQRVFAFGVNTPWKYVLLGAFYSLNHSLLEEYFFRWFLFGQLRRLVPLWPAILISAVGFMLHHVVILGTYLRWSPLPTAFFSLCIAVGGIFWAWLYDCSGSIAGPCLSHLLVDAAIFLVGFDIMRSLWMK
jgi:CAAX protease family protein